jgi:hypothetical protein
MGKMITMGLPDFMTAPCCGFTPRIKIKKHREKI